ncbi:tricorn protease homolog 1 [Arthrobacter sp. Hiyo4]|nr:tricorn protease homolog 1 [Arthrobacter sp. Hiyo4]
MVRVDPAGLAHRVIGVPVPQGNYTSLTATEGALLWLDWALAGVTGDGKASQEDKDARPSLVRFDLARRKSATLVEALDSYRLSGDGKKVVLVNDKQVSVVPSAAKADEESGQLVKVDLGRIRVMMDPLSVWGQAFDEAWRLQRDFFWAEDMAGQDWESIHKRYRPIVDRLGSHDDLVDLLWSCTGNWAPRTRTSGPQPSRKTAATARDGLAQTSRSHRRAGRSPVSWPASPRTRWPPRR